MVTTKRQNLILNSIVKEYIALAKPVSSQTLEKEYQFDLSPATLRIEMQRLTDKGFLYQPHTSAGRIPTDKGYRFFVDDLLESIPFDLGNILKIQELLREESKDVLRFVARLTKFLAETSSSFAILNLLEKDLFWKEGWEEIFAKPEFREKGFIPNFVEILDSLEKATQSLKINSGIKIYIGKENPFSRARDFSIILSECHFPSKGKGIVSLLGPKRMAYDRNIALINSFKKILDNF